MNERKVPLYMLEAMSRLSYNIQVLSSELTVAMRQTLSMCHVDPGYIRNENLRDELVSRDVSFKHVKQSLDSVCVYCLLLKEEIEVLNSKVFADEKKKSVHGS